MYMWTYEPHTCLAVRGQLGRVSSFPLPLWGFQGLIQGVRFVQQVSLPAESLWPWPRTFVPSTSALQVVGLQKCTLEPSPANAEDLVMEWDMCRTRCCCCLEGKGRNHEQEILPLFPEKKEGCLSFSLARLMLNGYYNKFVQFRDTGFHP